VSAGDRVPGMSGSGAAVVSLPDLSRSRRPALGFRGLVLLTDLWILISVLWVGRSVFGRVDVIQLLFALLVFSALAWPAEERRLTRTVLDDVGPIWKRVILSFAACAAVSITFGTRDLRLLLWTAAVTACGVLLGRVAAHSLGRKGLLHARPRALVVGAGRVSRQIIGAVAQDDCGFDIVGAVDDEPRFGSDELGTPILGHVADLASIVKQHGITTVIIGFTLADPSQLIALVRRAQSQGASVWVVPRFYELGLPGVTKQHVWGLPLIKLASPPTTRPAWALKRGLDFGLAAVGMLLAAPMMAIISAAILFDSGRPILFRQTRISTNGRRFHIFKFRTMTVAHQPVDSTEWSPDPGRVTRLGSFLRDKSLDELPQLFNVLHGDMSLVGPRPERPAFAEEFSHEYYGYDQRLRVPGGMTGWAQVNGLRGADSPIEDRVAFDNYYIENWSLSEDLKIMAKTVGVLRGHQAGRGRDKEGR
jgi:exopolysaccharide biosynthesis polyprenyl glycosylphosphotransferase